MISYKIYKQFLLPALKSTCLFAQVQEQPPVMITFLSWSTAEVYSLTTTTFFCLPYFFMDAFSVHILDALIDYLAQILN